MKRMNEFIFRFRAAIFLGMTAFGLSQCYGCTDCGKKDYQAFVDSQERIEFEINFDEFIFLVNEGRMEEANQLYVQLTNQRIIPEFENKDGYIEAKNLHIYYRSDAVRSCFKKSMIEYGLSCKENDIEFSAYDTLKVKLCDCKGSKSSDKYKKIEDCKSNCNTVAALVGAAVCYGLPRPCQITCVGMIEALRRKCEACCQTTSFYDSCVRPLHSYDPPPCDWNEKD